MKSWIGAGVGLLVLTCTLSVMTGPADIRAPQVLAGLVQLATFGYWQPSWAQVEPWQLTILTQVRLPRVLCAALVGMALAVSGTVLQGLFRNPLASPGVLGVSSGASLGAVIAIFLGLPVMSVWLLPSFALLGAGLSLWLVYRLATAGGHTPMATLLLAGVAVGAFNVALSSLVLAFAMQDWEVGRAIVFWTMGGLDGRSWLHVLMLVPVCGVGLALVWTRQRELDCLLLGEVQARAVGVDVARTRWLLLVVTAVLTGGAVAVAGGVGFVGLVVPHMARLLIGPHHRQLLPLSALLGALLVVLADWSVRGQSSVTTMPLGVITASVGAPFFLYLLVRQQREGRV